MIYLKKWVLVCSVCADMCSPNSNSSCRNVSGKGFISLINLKTEVGGMFTTEEGLGIPLIEFYTYDPLKSVLISDQTWALLFSYNKWKTLISLSILLMPKYILTLKCKNTDTRTMSYVKNISTKNSWKKKHFPANRTSLCWNFSNIPCILAVHF